MKTQRILRTVPAALLMTTALSWNLPAMAQNTVTLPGAKASATAPATTTKGQFGGTGGAAASSGAAGSLTAPATDAAGTTGTSGTSSSGSLPPGFKPATTQSDGATSSSTLPADGTSTMGSGTRSSSTTTPARKP